MYSGTAPDPNEAGKRCDQPQHLLGSCSYRTCKVDGPVSRRLLPQEEGARARSTRITARNDVARLLCQNCRALTSALDKGPLHSRSTGRRTSSPCFWMRL
jgi:hypothetical protein